METEPKKQRKPRRTKEQMEAERGADLARAVSALPMAHLRTFTGALAEEVAEHLLKLIGGAK